MMSLKALGIWTFIQQNPHVKISRRSIANHVKDGERSINSALNELVELGYLELVNVKIDTRNLSYYKVTWRETNPGTWCETLPPLSGNKLNNLNTNNTYDKDLFTNIIRTKAFSEIENGKEENKVGYPFFEKSGSSDSDKYEAEIKSLKDKARAESKREFNAAKQARKEAKFVENANKPISEWNSTNVAWEFRRRIEDLWHVAPETNTVRMNAAFGANRAKFQTTPEVEYEMLNIFFAGLTDTSNKTCEMLWKSFTSQWETLAHRAKAAVSLPDDLEKAKKEAEESWKKVMDV